MYLPPSYLSLSELHNMRNKEMAFYEEDECNAFYGTDQTIFPAFMNPDEGVGAYEPLICRTLVSIETAFIILCCFCLFLFFPLNPLKFLFACLCFV